MPQNDCPMGYGAAPAVAEEMLTRLQSRFGPDSANAEHPLAQLATYVRLLEREYCDIGDG